MAYLKEFCSWSWTKKIGSILIVVGAGVGIWVIIAGGHLAFSFTPNKTKAISIQPFMTGLVAPLFTLGSALLVLENLRLNSQQNLSNNFFKLLDFHHKLVDGISTTVTGISGPPIEQPATPQPLAQLPDDILEHVTGPWHNIYTEGTGLTEEGKKLLLAVHHHLSHQQTEANAVKPPSSSEKRGFFDDLAERIATDFENNTNTYTGQSIQATTSREKLVELYRCYYNVHQSDLGHYVRHFQRIMEFLQHARFERRNREDMLALFKTQLSNYELLLLAYHGIAYEKCGLATMLENNQFLEYLNPEHEADTHGMMQRIIEDRTVLTTAYSHLADKEGFKP